MAFQIRQSPYFYRIIIHDAHSQHTLRPRSQVQGVFFRAHTEKRAQELNLVGFVRNTERGTVVGVVQGSEPSMQKMEHWLRHTGSPHSRIDRCEFRNERYLDVLEYAAFKQQRTGLA